MSNFIFVKSSASLKKTGTTGHNSDDRWHMYVIHLNIAHKKQHYITFDLAK